MTSGAVLAVLFMGVALSILACSSGGNNSSALTVDDLASMVLTKEELGEKFADLNHVPEESGPATNEDLLELSSDRQALQAQIEEHGRVTGYSQNFQGRVLINIELSLHEDEDGASAALATQSEPILDYRELGATVEEFEAEGIGNESRGIDQGTEPPGGLSTHVLFRQGRIFAWVVISHSVAPPNPIENYQPDAIELARKLAEKIEAMLDE